MKDYYDIYFFLTELKNEIDEDIMKKALKNTVTQRNSLDSLKDYKIILNNLIEQERIHKNWNSYKNKTKYAKDIEFDNIIKILLNFLDKNVKDIIQENP